MYVAIEQGIAEEYLKHSIAERPLIDCLASFASGVTFVVVQGFEERTCGVLRTLADARVKVDRIAIARYAQAGGFDETNTSQFEKWAARVAPKNWRVVPNHNDGEWVENALEDACDTVVVDITGVSNRAMFRTLDHLNDSGKNVYIAYSEAEQYWPKKSEWDDLKKHLTAHQSIAEVLDRKPWMFSYEHRVELVPGHEGYDAGGTGRALVAFLPFKCSRLAAVLGDEDYTEKLFIAGCPPAKELGWRLDALKDINESLTRGSRVEVMSTFGYRETLAGLGRLLFREDSLLWKYDVHLAALGSKLQTVGSWIFSRLVPSMTVLTSVPSRYYKDAFSKGIGRSWVFPLTHLKPE